MNQINKDLTSAKAYVEAAMEIAGQNDDSQYTQKGVLDAKSNLEKVQLVHQKFWDGPYATGFLSQMFSSYKVAEIGNERHQALVLVDPGPGDPLQK